MLLDIDYNGKSNCIILYNVENTATSTSVIPLDKFKPYLYLKSDKNNLEKYINEEPKFKSYILDIMKTEKNIINLNIEEFPRVNKEKILKIYSDNPSNIPKLRKLQNIGNIYEHDIPFTKRYLIDNNKNINLLNYENIHNISRIAFDMEVYFDNRAPEPNKDPILMVSFYSENFKKVITYNNNFNHKYVEYVKDEKELIKKTTEILRKYNIIYTYNGDNFDFPYLKKRAENLGIKLDFGEGKTLKLSKGGINLKSEIKGIVHIDTYPIARRTLKLTKYKLEEVSKKLFNIDKLEVGHKNIVPMWNENNNNLIEYSLQDAKYTYKIGEYFLPLELMFSNIVKQCLGDICRMSSSNMVEYLLLKHSYNKNYLAPNRPYSNQYLSRLKEGIEGGYVKEPIVGIHENIISMDFRSLYPSIIISYNISPDTINCKCCKEDSTKINNYWFCKKRKGLIPEILKDLIERRKKIKKELKNKKNINDINNSSSDNNNKNNKNIEYTILDYEQQSIKILTNSFYGYMAYPRARWYSKQCAETITYLGRKYIQDTITEVEKNGFEVIYADTDGLYAKPKENIPINELKEKAQKFLKKINNNLPKDMELEYEGHYKRGIFLTKKRYALIDDNNKLIIKGLEYVRRDWSNIAKNTQINVINALLKEGDINLAKKIIKTTIKKLKDGKIPIEDLIIYKQLTKNTESYATPTPHTSVAKLISEKGEEVKIGDVIGFVIEKGKAPISERARIPEEVKEYDPNYYIDNQVLPPVLRIMESIGISKDELKNDKKQSTLDSFF